MLGALPHQVGNWETQFPRLTLQLGCKHVTRSSNMKFQYGRVTSKEATAVRDCILVMGAEHGRGHEGPGGSRAEMLPAACAKGSGIKPVARPVGVWVLFMAAEPLAPFSISARHPLSQEYPLRYTF